MNIQPKTGLFWFRHDLRLNDNLALFRLAVESDALLPVFVVDPATFKPQSLHCRRMGQQRWQFLSETLVELHKELKAKGSDLVICEGPPEQEIVKLIKRHKAVMLGVSRDCGVYEKKQLQTIQEACPELEIISEESNTLFRQEQLPFAVQDLPGHFTPFRKQVEGIRIDPPAKATHLLPPPPKLIRPQPDIGRLLQKYQANMPAVDKVLFDGGRLSGLKRLDYYTFQTGKLSTYKATRNGMLGFDDSSKISPWLANGALSVREVYSLIKSYEEEVGANESTYWLYFELLWREYFHWHMHKHQAACFRFSGVQNKSPLSSYWPERFQKWCAGQTPWPIVNACMRQLAATGYMSNRGRQIVASCLVHELNLDWRYGAAWFEQNLVDYDVASNWGNWQYLAGVGADPRGHRKFDLDKQTQQYDPNREFINRWCSAEESHILANTPIDSTDLVDWPIG